MRPAPIERVTVFGAGVMGSQIAALMANAGLEVDLLDLPANGDPAARARAGVEGLLGRRPAALFLPELAGRIRPGGLDDPAEALAHADWVIEAVVEALEAKRDLLERIAPLVPGRAFVTTNTSGLSIAALAEGRDDDFARRFFGVHFFNPPRQMKLVEVIPGPRTDPERVGRLAAFVRERLGKGVVECRDTPNFIANRLGVFAIMDALHRMVAGGLSVGEVDAVTGRVLGRPRSATLRLCDLIGLDTLLHVAGTAHAALEGDPCRGTFLAPPAVAGLVGAGRLGEKTGAGFYRKTEAGIEAVDPSTGNYRPLRPVGLELPARGPLGDRLAAVFDPANAGRLVRFARDHLVATLAYCAWCAPEVADALEDVDRALRWGFNWEAGPFELIDRIGAGTVAQVLADGGQPIPPLLERIRASEPERVYARIEGGLQVLAPDGTRRRPPRPSGPADDADLLAGGEVLMECDTARLVYLGEGAAAIEFAGKLNVLGPASLAFALQAVEEEAFEMLVLTGAGGHFTAGADLHYVLALIDAANWGELEGYLRTFQDATAAMRYASVPVVVAARGLALGGGCEFCLSAAARVVDAELHLGLVETKVGLIPGAGGCKEMVRRFGADVEGFLATLLEGRMSDNALQAQRWGFLDDADDVRIDGDRLLVPALARARQVAEGGWRPPRPEPLEVAGAAEVERLCAVLEADAAAGRISVHDAGVGKALVRVVCGGGADGTVTEERLLELEREAFLQLCGTEATRARIAHMLDTGKPLRN